MSSSFMPTHPPPMNSQLEARRVLRTKQKSMNTSGIVTNVILTILPLQR